VADRQQLLLTMEESKALEAQRAAADKAAAVENRLRDLRTHQRQSLTIEESEFLASADALADERERARRATVSLQERRQASRQLSLLADFHSDPARAGGDAAARRQLATWALMPDLLV